MSPQECEYCIAVATPFLQPLDKLYEQRTRMADRAMIRSPMVAQQLYKRILPMLRKEDYADRTPLCFGHDGVWVPLGLNECLKFFRYEPEGVFVDHRDGPWVPRQDQCSMYTVVVYLNDDFNGGKTAISGAVANEHRYGVRYGYVSDPRGVVPEVGTALILNHDCWHGGEAVEMGYKWILRTELIFQRVYSFYVDKDAFATDALYLEARQLYDSSMAASAAGDRKSFFEQYQRVIQLQRDAMLHTDAAKAKERIFPCLGADELSLIMGFLTPSEVVGAFLRLNKRTYAATVLLPYWQDRWEHDVVAFGGGSTYPIRLATQAGGNVEAGVVGPLATMLALKGVIEDDGDADRKATSFEHRSVGMAYDEISSEVPGGNHRSPSTYHSDHTDYFGRYRQFVWMQRQRGVTALALTSSGPLLVSGLGCIFSSARTSPFFSFSRWSFKAVYPMTALPPTAAEEGEGPPPEGVEATQPVALSERNAPRTAAPVNWHGKWGDIVAKRRGFDLRRSMSHYYVIAPHAAYHMNLPQHVRCQAMHSAAHRSWEAAIVHPPTGAVEWSVLGNNLVDAIPPMDTPILVVTHPRWHMVLDDATIASVLRSRENEARRALVEALRGKSQADVLRYHMTRCLDGLLYSCRFPSVAFCHPAVCAVVGFFAKFAEQCITFTTGPFADAEEIVVELCYSPLQHTESSTTASDKQERYFYKINRCTYSYTQLAVGVERDDRKGVYSDKEPIDPKSVALRFVECAPDGERDLLESDLLADAEELVLARSANSTKSPHTAVYPLAEAIAHGTMALMALPNLSEALVCGY